MSQRLSSKKTAFVFSGGASLGAIEVGALKAVIEEGIQADMVLGTSVGSLNGALYAYNPTLEGVEVMERIWRQIKTSEVFPISPIKPVLNFTTAGHYLVSSKNLRNLIIQNLPYTRIEETTLPLYIICTDIKSGQEIVFNKGLVLEALLASAGIPAVFPPLSMHERFLVDGGVVNNAPISTAVRLGAKRVVVFPIGLPPENQEPKNYLQILIRSLIYLLNRQLASDIQLYKDTVELIIVPPPTTLEIKPHDFSASGTLVDEGYKVAKAWLQKEGFTPNADTCPQPCDVFCQPIHFLEAIEPDPEKSTLVRVKENIKLTAESLKDALAEKAEKLSVDVADTAEKIKEKVFKKRSEDTP
ncbi:MAG: patatin-like phospholipase family protein [Candidatus Gerdarchaeota archaeon]|nr:MAG: patatin-like phospholipase family protein [Candidatus Gerdarchaeota archaeon]RLI70868.1 MAG: patatin-like phospholipase family protein [Candidatus Gerdarchaeota archaeon]